MNATYLECSEQLDSFFSNFLNKIKLYILQNISRCSIHGLRPFKYKNTCELCDNTQDKDKRGVVMVNKRLLFASKL